MRNKECRWGACGERMRMNSISVQYKRVLDYNEEDGVHILLPARGSLCNLGLIILTPSQPDPLHRLVVLVKWRRKNHGSHPQFLGGKGKLLHRNT